MSRNPCRTRVRRHYIFAVYPGQCFFVNHKASVVKAFGFSMPGFAFVDHDLVAIRIQKDGEAANG